MEELSKYVGSKIKKLRLARGLTQEELGKLLDVRKSAIANYESGYRSPKQDLLFKLSEVFSISIDEFFPPTITTPQKEDINYIYSHLDEKRQQVVYDFAKYQLESQKKDNYLSFPNTKAPSVSDNKEEFMEEFMVVAAHMKENLSEEEKEELFNFIDAAKQKEIDKKRNR